MATTVPEQHERKEDDQECRNDMKKTTKSVANDLKGQPNKDAAYDKRTTTAVDSSYYWYESWFLLLVREPQQQE